MADNTTGGATKAMVPRLLQAGVEAPKMLLKAAIGAQLEAAAKYVKALPPRDSPGDVQATVDKVIKAHRHLARTEGAAAGVAMSAAEMTTIVGTGGTATVPVAALTLAGDLAGLAWIQVRMVLIIAALYGHDMTDRQARTTELGTLFGLYGAHSATAAAERTAAASQRVLKRLLMRYLKGEPLKAITAMFRMVGINFARAGLIRALPLVNIPINAAVNDAATAALGRKARAYYGELPASLA
jgi:uncharacterized protein (DUF697 family)